MERMIISREVMNDIVESFIERCTNAESFEEFLTAPYEIVMKSVNKCKTKLEKDIIWYNFIEGCRRIKLDDDEEEIREFVLTEEHLEEIRKTEEKECEYKAI